MAELKVPNLCGAVAEFNAIQDKFESLISDAVDSLESEASALASTATSALNSLESDLRSLIPELPSLPAINLQGQLTSLSSMIPGSFAHLQLLASITTQFGTALTSGGYSLDSLVSDAAKALSGGLDLCSAVPNFEVPAAGGDAIEKAVESKQATKDSEEEKPSVIVKNVNLIAVIAAVEKKVAAYDIGTKIPTEDTAVYKVASKTTEVVVSSTTEVSSGDPKPGSTIKAKVTTSEDSTTTRYDSALGRNVTIRNNIAGKKNDDGFAIRLKIKRELWKQKEFDAGLLEHAAYRILGVKAFVGEGKGQRYRSGRITSWARIYNDKLRSRAKYPEKYDFFTLGDDRREISFTEDVNKFIPATDTRGGKQDGVIIKISYMYNDNYDPNFASLADE